MDNAEAIGFALDQLLAAPEPSQGERTTEAKPLHGLGTMADDLIRVLEHAVAMNDWRSVEQIVADALRSSGADIVSKARDSDVHADFAVWSDVLEPFVGNPLLVEVKARFRSNADVIRAARQLASYVDASGCRWALLLHGEGLDRSARPWDAYPPNILVLSLRSLLDSLRTRAFAEVVRDLRNRRVHGLSSEWL